MTKSCLQLMLLCCLAAAWVPAALADYYKYTDSGRTVNISNSLETVPQKYRSRVKVIRDETLTKQDLGARKLPPPAAAAQEESNPPGATAAAAAPAPQGKFAQLSGRYSWFKPLLYLAGVLAGFLVVVKVAALVPSAALSKLIYLSFFLGVFVFLYQAYVTHVVEDSLAVKEKAIIMMKKSSLREIPLPGEAPGAEGK